MTTPPRLGSFDAAINPMCRQERPPKPEVKVQLEFSGSHCNYGCGALVVTRDGDEYCALYPDDGRRLQYDRQSKLPCRRSACIAAHGGVE